MIPIPNVLAGILIGLFNQSWTSLLIACLGWGLIFYIYVFIIERQRRYNFEAAYVYKRGEDSHNIAKINFIFFTIEYSTALFTSLLFSIITKLIKSLF